MKIVPRLRHGYHEPAATFPGSINVFVVPTDPTNCTPSFHPDAPAAAPADDTPTHLKIPEDYDRYSWTAS